MPKKVYRSRKKTGGSTGKKALIGLCGIALIAGVVALALHYSFENDKRVKPTTTTPISAPIPSASLRNETIKKAIPKPPSAYLEYSDLVFGESVTNMEQEADGAYTVKSTTANGWRAVSITSGANFDNHALSINSNGNYMYRISINWFCFIETLEPDGTNVVAELALGMPSTSIKSAFVYDYYNGGAFKELSVTSVSDYASPWFDSTIHINQLSDGTMIDANDLWNYASGDFPDIFIITDKDLDSGWELILGAESWDAEQQYAWVIEHAKEMAGSSNTAEKGFFAQHVYSKTYDYPSGIFTVGGERELFTDLASAPTLESIVGEIKLSDYGEATLEVISTDYDPKTVGDYRVALKATDTSGNISTLDLIIHVVDYQPIIRAKSGNSTDITIGYSRLKDWQMILDMFEAFDYTGQPISISLKNPDWLRFGRVGTYHPIIAATDSDGREVTLTLTITVTDDLPPVFLFSNALCYVSKEKPLSIEELKKTILATNKLTASEVNTIEIYENTYTENARKAGDYSIGYEISLLSSEKKAGTMSIKVLDQAINVESRTPFAKFLDTIKNGWTEFWIKLGNLIRFRGWTL